MDDTATTAEDTDTDSGTTLSGTAVTMPSNGTAAITSGSTTTVTYTPDADYNGTDSSDYTLFDWTDTGTVTVTVGPAAKPTGLTATSGDSQVMLTWDDPSNSSITGYQNRLQAQTAKLDPSDGSGGDLFGNSVAVDGDTVVVGAYLDDVNDANNNQVSNAGSAYVFTKPATGWTATSTAAKLTASDGAATNHFGRSVAVDADAVVVGAYGTDNFKGSAYVFTKPEDGWETTTNPTAKLTASDGAGGGELNGDQFGNSVAVDGDKGGNSGSAYVFAKPSGGWATGTETAKLTANDGASGDRLGISVAVDGDTAVVGASAYSGGQGRAYLFTKPSGVWVTTSEAAELVTSDVEKTSLGGR